MAVESDLKARTVVIRCPWCKGGDVVADVKLWQGASETIITSECCPTGNPALQELLVVLLEEEAREMA